MLSYSPTMVQHVDRFLSCTFSPQWRGGGIGEVLQTWSDDYETTDAEKHDSGEAAVAGVFEACAMCEGFPRATVLRSYLWGKERPALTLTLDRDTGMYIPPDAAPPLVTAVEVQATGILKEDWAWAFRSWIEEAKWNAATANGQSRSTSPSSAGESSGSTCVQVSPPRLDVPRAGLRDVCCAGWALVPLQLTDAPQSCFLLEKWAAKNTCCTRISLRFCVTCQEAFCGDASCSRSQQHWNCTTRPSRCPCAQLQLPGSKRDKHTARDVSFCSDGIYALPNAVLCVCERCGKVTCGSCLDRHVGALIMENIPSSWRDADIIEAVEICVQARILGFERVVNDGHAYIQFERQILLIGTQCLKLKCVATGSEVLLKPPHQPRRLRGLWGRGHPRQANVVVQLPHLRIGANLPLAVACIASRAGLQPQDILFACEAPYEGQACFTCILYLADQILAETLASIEYCYIDGALFAMSVFKGDDTLLDDVSSPEEMCQRNYNFFLTLKAFYQHQHV